MNAILTRLREEPVLLGMTVAFILIVANLFVAVNTEVKLAADAGVTLALAWLIRGRVTPADPAARVRLAHRQANKKLSNV